MTEVGTCQVSPSKLPNLSTHLWHGIHAPGAAPQGAPHPLVNQQHKKCVILLIILIDCFISVVRQSQQIDGLETNRRTNEWTNILTAMILIEKRSHPVPYAGPHAE